jgi:hypothetical protein
MIVPVLASVVVTHEKDHQPENAEERADQP